MHRNEVQSRSLYHISPCGLFILSAALDLVVIHIIAAIASAFSALRPAQGIGSVTDPTPALLV